MNMANLMDIVGVIDMEIIIKKKIPSTKETTDSDGVEVLTPILSIYFDVLTPGIAYVDNDDIGYFPIEIVADIDTPDEDIIAACEKWITDNDVLSHYAGKLRNRDEDVAAEIGKTYSLTDELQIIRTALAELLPDDVDVQAWDIAVKAAKIKFPKLIDVIE